MANKYKKKYSTSLALKEMQIKTRLRFYSTTVRMPSWRAKTAPGKDMLKQELLYTDGGDTN
jgi:hypothetical protein